MTTDELNGQCVAKAPEWPLAERASVTVQYWPDEKNPGLCRLKVSLEINGESVSSICDTIIDPVPGNGIICSASNLTPMLVPYIDRLRATEAKLEKAKEALEFYASGTHTVVYDLKEFTGDEPLRERGNDFKTDSGERARAALKEINDGEL